ncbi:hypothetical protein I4P58_04825 [Enterobacter roggenkampii]|uniref:hypothetical protein n=1 Tax=Enterobacter roggenkampii TaxID=1812935 RepID=UPI0018C2DD02|nr:hypothetical protein [Enterobacter roggenkampii]MBF9816334.1 hypothetical protein [Enterobacter roggenkampii]
MARWFDITVGEGSQPGSDELLGQTSEQIREHFYRQSYSRLTHITCDDLVIVGIILR